MGLSAGLAGAAGFVDADGALAAGVESVDPPLPSAFPIAKIRMIARSQTHQRRNHGFFRFGSGAACVPGYGGGCWPGYG